MMSLETQQERVRITAYFQGETENQKSSLTLGRVILQLPDSKTRITLLLPKESVHERSEPLKFCVKREGNWREEQLEGLRLTVEKANRFGMTIYVFKHGENVGPMIRHQDGTTCQQPTVKRSESKVQVTRPAKIEPGAHYRLEITSTNGSSAEANLIKIEGPIQKSKTMGDDSKLFRNVYPSIMDLLRQKVLDAENLVKKSVDYADTITFKSRFNEELAKQSILTAINGLHSEKRGQLEKMCETDNSTQNIPLGRKAVSLFLLALERTDIGQLLQDQLEAAVGKDYPILLGIVYNDILVPFIDEIKFMARQYDNEI
ncbi:MAG: hypothetical protein H7A40_01380 [Chlamydiales bacterium]|nr:hypothetical protein [Chlamydiales bacterium]